MSKGSGGLKMQFSKAAEQIFEQMPSPDYRGGSNTVPCSCSSGGICSLAAPGRAQLLRALWAVLMCLFASALLLALLPGMGRGTRETVLGTLGKATVLWIPQEFQNLTQSFGVATWKRDTADPHSKEVLLKYMNGNYTNYAPSQNHFHSSNFSLEILSTKRQDQRLYEYIISKDAKEKVWQIQLEVYGERHWFRRAVVASCGAGSGSGRWAAMGWGVGVARDAPRVVQDPLWYPQEYLGTCRPRPHLERPQQAWGQIDFSPPTLELEEVGGISQARG